jgi:ATP-independent RNA helicase DbpA
VLRDRGISAVALHGDLEQAQRSQVLVRFSNRSASVLVATDVAARGLHIEGVDVVFNYELPPQPNVYVHRIGRTGRAGRRGVAVSLVTQRELPRLAAIEAQLPSGGIQLHALPESVPAEALTTTLTTLEINGGRRSKLRPGDLLGALTAGGSIPGKAVGRIDLFDETTYVAVDDLHVSRALRLLNQQKIKGRQFRARSLPTR